MITIPMPKLNTRVLSIYVTSLFESKKHSGWSAFYYPNLSQRTPQRIEGE